MAATHHMVEKKRKLKEDEAIARALQEEFKGEHKHGKRKKESTEYYGEKRRLPRRNAK